MTNHSKTNEQSHWYERSGTKLVATGVSLAIAAAALAGCATNAETKPSDGPTQPDPKSTSEVSQSPSSNEIMNSEVPGTQLVERPKASDIDPSLQEKFIEADNLARTDYRKFIELPEATKLMWRSAYEDEVTHSISTTVRQASDPIFELNKTPKVGDTGASVMSSYVRAADARIIGFKNFDEKVLDGNQQVSDVNMDLSYFSTAFLLDEANPGYKTVSGRFHNLSDLASLTYTDPSTNETSSVLLEKYPGYSLTVDVNDNMLADSIKGSVSVDKKTIGDTSYDTVETVVTTDETYRYISVLVPYKNAKDGKDANQWVLAYINDF